MVGILNGNSTMGAVGSTGPGGGYMMGKQRPSWIENLVFDNRDPYPFTRWPTVSVKAVTSSRKHGTSLARQAVRVPQL